MQDGVVNYARARDLAEDFHTERRPVRQAADAVRDDRVRAVFVDRSQLGQLLTQWDDLSKNAVEKNPFYTSWMLLPALDHLRADAVEVACVFDRGGRRLLGLAPFQIMNTYARLPMPILKNWVHEQCFFGAPLVRRGFEKQVFGAFGDLLDRGPTNPLLMRFSHQNASGPLAAAAREVAAATGRRSWITGRYERAALFGPIDFGDYVQTAVRKKKRKELRRLFNRLSENGAVRCDRLSGAGDLDAWIDEFLSLESASWKGRVQSALASTPEQEAFFRTAVAGACEQDAVRFYRLTVGDKTVAMIVNFLLDENGFSFKICHDEAFSRYSPGVLLEIEMLKKLDGAPFSVFDSCAAPDHSMINSLWRDRIEIVGFNIGRSGRVAGAVLSCVQGLEAVAAKVRERQNVEKGTDR